MASEFALSVVAPDRSVVETTVSSAMLPGSEGYFGVLRGHLPLVAALRPGLVEYSDPNGQRHVVVIGGGFAEVQGDRVTILADSAELAKEIDLARAEKDLDEARRALRGESSTMTSEEATLELDRAIQRVRAARTVR
ncbi:MAG: ATP synthase F1 subunit epsilon [Fimbriimonas sp.]